MRMIFHNIGQLIMAVAVTMSAPFCVSATEIAVTLPPLAGLVSMLDKQMQVICLLPAGADPHHFQLTPRRIEALSRTQLLIRASFDDGGWPLPPSHAHTLNLWPATGHGWLNPQTVRTALPLIGNALTRLHPEQEQAITASLHQALKQTRDIEQAWHEALSAAKVSGILMQHPAWRGLMQSMDVPVFAVLESTHHGHEHGPHKLEHALATLNQHPDAWLLADSNHSNRALDWLARHSAHRPHRITLNALGDCGLPWPQLMLQNIAQIRTMSEQARP
ncbi:MAG: zinc ABC transporter substrate-binding protein [Mariprofundus sp.]|nr:zinc ABC transporter substrate-binding protein [Mariprofundus sp.]